jgi:triacylglycerol lipase
MKRKAHLGQKCTEDLLMLNSYRFVYGMDIVPALPRAWQGYRHVDAEHRLGSRFSLNFFSQRFKDHKIENYINALKEVA